MKRALQPATRNGAARYPRIALAWRILVGAAPILAGAGIARADATVPQAPKPDKPKGPATEAPSKNPKPHPHPHYGGKMVSPSVDIDGHALRLQLHPHDPGEPCFTDEEVEV